MAAAILPLQSRNASIVHTISMGWSEAELLLQFHKKKKSSKAQLPFLISVIGSRSKLSETGSGQTDTDTANSLTTNLVLSESKPMKCLSQAKHGNWRDKFLFQRLFCFLKIAALKIVLTNKVYGSKNKCKRSTISSKQQLYNLMHHSARLQKL